MDNIDYLKGLFTESYSISLSSGVYRDLTTTYPSAVVWMNNNDINITNKQDYYANKYYLKNIILLYETTDFDEIVLLYRMTAFKYLYGEEETLSNLISFLESRSSLKLTKVDNKSTNKYN